MFRRPTPVALVLLGLALAGWAALRASTAPLALTLALIGGGALLVVLGIGVGRGSRAAWAFAVAQLGVLSAAGLLAMPGIVRGGAPPVLAGLALAAVAGTLALLLSLPPKT